MNRNLFNFKNTALTVVLCMAFNTIAIHRNFNSFQSSSAISSYPASMFYVEQDNYSSLPTTTNHTNHIVKNNLILHIDHSYPTYIANSYHYIFEIEVKSFDENMSPSTQTINLPIEYNPNPSPGMSYKDRSAFVFSGAHKIEAKILSVKTPSGTIVSDPEDNIILTINIDIERYWTFTPSATSCVVVTANDLNSDMIDDELELNWTTLNGAEAYELEWTWVDDYGTALNTPKSASEIDWNFINNSTRVIITDNQYKINLVFERGYVLFRVRGVGKNISNPSYDIFGDWSRPNSGTNPTSGTCSSSYYYVDEDHRKDFNWQYSSVYAEEGKKKEIASYYDGSLRNRQTVTKVNTDNTAIVAETIYDFNGREAINILPVPLQSPALDYYANLNLNTNTTPSKYTFLDFDLDVDVCTSGTDSMRSVSGASRYYGPSNPLQIGNNAYIPNANSYPFSQIEYTPDNTGRIRRQGGVGIHHQLGSGHETKYYYGQPMQVELDRLFGSEVGYARHYKKNMIIDPNGQISISYMDQEGRVIATALTGDKPSNVTELPSRPSTALETTADLFASDANNISLLNIPNIGYTAFEFNTYLLVSEPGEHTFHYGMNPLTYDEECMDEICLDCIYDLDIIIRDECGEIVEQKTVVIGGPTLNTTCSTAYFSESLDPFMVELEIGYYQITKTLSVNRSAYEYYLAEFLKPENNSCLPDFQTLLDEEKLKLDYDGCEITCEQCADALGTIDEFVLAGKGTKETWQEEYNACYAPCRNANTCEAVYTMLLGDISPGGQYAEYFDTTTNTVSVSDFQLSILNFNNLLPDGGRNSSDPEAAYWKNPRREVYVDGVPTFVFGYYENDGQTRSKIEVAKLPNDQGYTPATTSTFIENGKTYTYPENLVNVKDFIVYWQSSWSFGLVYFHPEYCYYRWCIENLNTSIVPHGLTSEEFDQKLIEIETWDEAESEIGTLSTFSNLVNLDPYFNASGRSSQKSDIIAKMGNYESGLDALEVSAMSLFCPGFYGTSPALPSSCTDYSGATTEEKDEIWNMFKSFYLSYKTTIIEQDANDYANTTDLCNKGINTCIGDDQFLFGNSGMGLQKFVFQDTFTCSWRNYYLYQNKTKRFNMVVELSDEDKNKAEYNSYYYSGKCQLDLELITLLNEIAAKGELDSDSIELFTYKGFSPKIHEMLLLTMTSPTPGTYYNWKVYPSLNFSNEILTLSFGTSIYDPFAYSITLELPSGSNWITNTISSFSDFEIDILEDNPWKFSLVGKTNTDQLLNVKGETTFPLNSCEFADVCMPTDYTIALVNLMNGLTDNGTDLTSLTSIDIDANYPTLSSRFIKNQVGGAPLTWVYNGSGVFSINSGAILIDFINHSGLTSTDIENIKYFTNIRIGDVNIQNSFVVTAWYGTSAPYSQYDLYIDVNVGITGKCYDPVPITCDNKQLQATRDFEALLSDILQTMPTTEVDLLENNLLTSNLETYVGSNVSTVLTNQDYSNPNEIYMEIGGYDATPTLLNKTYIKLYRKNKDYFTINGSLSTIQEVGYLKTEGNGSFQGKEHNFTLLVKFPNGNTETIYGYVSTIPIESCTICGDPTGTPPECLYYDLYVEEVTKFNSRNPSKGTTIIDISNTSFSCECVLNYIVYLKSFDLANDLYIGPDFGDNCAETPIKPNALDIVNFNILYGCDISWCDECLLWGGSPIEWTGTPTEIVFNSTIGAFNSITPKPIWHSDIEVTYDSIEPLDCRCAVKYAVYLNRWLNINNAESPTTGVFPNFQPLTFGEFKGNGCQANDCWWQYKHYRLQTIAATGMPVPYDETIDCNCWLQFTKSANLTTHTATQLSQYCKGIPGGLNNPYPDVDWNESLKISLKDYSLREIKFRKPNFCGNFSISEEFEPEDNCTEWLDNVAFFNATLRYDAIIQELVQEFTDAYYQKCMSTQETFTLEYPNRDYHYTLYYYDQAGSLVRTVPPAGVKLVTESEDFDQINYDRTNHVKTFYTNHILNTVYEYNSLNQLVKQSVPDHDKMDRWFVKNSSGIPSGFVANDIKFTDPNNGQMIGIANDVSMILQTSDGGRSWSRKYDIYTDAITKVAMADNDVGYAVGKGGLFLKTVDGGVNWQIVTLDNKFTHDLYDIVVRKNGSNYEGILSGANSVFESFEDNGSTISWSSISFPSGVNGNIISLSFKETSTGTGYGLVDDNGTMTLISCSTWAGTWANTNLKTITRSNKLKSVYMIDGSNGFIGGIDGILLKTANGGVNWVLLETGLNVSFEKLFFPSDAGLTNKGMALGSDGNLYSTSDGGNTWVRATGVGTYHDFHFYDAVYGNGVGVGNSGLITTLNYVSGNLRVNPMNIKQNVTANLYSVWFADANNGLVGGQGGKIFKIEDASSLPLIYSVSSSIGTGIIDIYMNSATMGAAIDSIGNLYKVSISGSAPTYSGTITNLTVSGEFFISLDNEGGNLYALDSQASSANINLYTASNPVSGTSNSFTIGSDDGGANGFTVFSSGKLIVVGEKGTIGLHTGSWSNNSSNVELKNLKAVHAVPSTNQIWLSGTSGKLVMSDNNGTLFRQQTTGVKYELNQLSFVSEDFGFVKGSGKQYLQIDDLSVVQRSLSIDATVQSIVAIGTDDAYILTSAQTHAVLYTDDGGETTTVLGGNPRRTGEFVTTADVAPNDKLIILGNYGAYSVKNTSHVFALSYNSPDEIKALDINSQKGMIVGINGVVLYTEDNGRTWLYKGQIKQSTNFENLNDVWVNSNGTGLIVGDNATAFQTVDFSAIVSFVFVSSPGSTDIQSISFNEHGVGIMAGENKIFRKLTTSNWKEYIIGSEVFNSAETQGDYAIIAGNNGIIYRSSDFNTGSPDPTFSLISAPTGTTTSDFRTVKMYDRSRAYILGTDGAIIKTVDWGNTWVRKFSDLNETYTSDNIRTIAIVNRDELVIAGDDAYAVNINDQADFISSMFWYDRLGRLVVSQNTKQYNKTIKAYSYTLFDDLGRVTEVGEKSSNDPIENTQINNQIDDALLSSWIASGGSSTRKEVTMTFYDEQMAPTGVLVQNNLKKRVSSIYYMDVHTNLTSGATTGYQHASHYTYDVHGTVPVVVQDIPALDEYNNQYKYINYTFDLVSGNVNQVVYNEGEADEFRHRYTYDGDNRIVIVETSRDGVLWDADANYNYYRHGPLARTELGDLKVQGVDFAYTIHGWLKGVNSNTMNNDRDIGKDGLVGDDNETVGRDAFGFTLGYYIGDYEDVSLMSMGDKFEADVDGSDLEAARHDFFNGNISHMVTCLPKAYDYLNSTTITPEAFGNAYTYDQLNRLSSSRTFTNLNYTTNQWQFNSITNPQAYATDYTYDAMGNILTQKRNGGGGSPENLDDLTYNYHTNGDGLISNRLYMVDDAVSSGNYSDDIDDQGTFDNTHSTIETSNNYGYDELGNLVRDDAEEIEEIVWNTYGKIKEVIRTSSSEKPDLEFLYDASGQRLAKIVKPKPIASVAQPQVATWYVRDAQGNVMAVYSYKMAVAVDEEAVECEDVVDFLVTEHGAETFANFTTQKIGAHNWTNGPDEIESAIITASKQMDVVYELNPSIILGSDYTLFTNVYSSFDQATLANLVVTDLGATTVSSSICTNTWIDHLYANNPNDYLTELNGINVLWMQQLYDALFPQPPNSPYPGFMIASGMIVGQPTSTVSNAINTLGGCLWNSSVASALETSNSGTLETAMTGYVDFKQELETAYGTTYLIGLMDAYSRTGLWDAIIATTLYTADDILAYYKTNDTENFVNIAVKNHPEGFCDMATDEGFEFMEHKAELKNFYGNQTYKNLMEHLKTLHSTEVQAFVLDELHIYGSSRLGVLKMDFTLVEFDEEENITFEAVASTEYMHRDLGQKRYELSNHLGNVLVTVTDKKVYVEDTGSVDHFLPEIMSISDYYPFGSPIAARAYASGEYRYGFNGMEKDDENNSGAYDFGARVYDGRLGRWFSLDPLFKKYPNESNYIFVSNNPIIYMDIKGMDKIITYIIKTEAGTLTRTVVHKNVVEFGWEKYSDGMGGSSYRPTAYDLYQTVTIDMTTGKSIIGEATRGPSIGLFEGFRQWSVFQGEGETFENRGGWMFTASDGAGSAGQRTKNKAVEISDIGTLLTYLGASKYGIKTLIDTRKDPEEVVAKFAELIEQISSAKKAEQNAPKEKKEGEKAASDSTQCDVKGGCGTNGHIHVDNAPYHKPGPGKKPEDYPKKTKK